MGMTRERGNKRAPDIFIETCNIKVSSTFYQGSSKISQRIFNESTHNVDWEAARGLFSVILNEDHLNA